MKYLILIPLFAALGAFALFVQTFAYNETAAVFALPHMNWAQVLCSNLTLFCFSSAIGAGLKQGKK